MHLQTNDLNFFFVGKSTNPTGATQANNPTLGGYIVDGEIAVLGEDGYTIQAAPTFANHSRIQLVQRFNNSLYKSNFINGVDVTQASFKAYAADTYKSMTLGFTGVTTVGSIDVSGSTADEFILKIISRFDHTFYNVRQYTRVYAYKNDLATQVAVASAMLKQAAREWLMGSGKVIPTMLADTVTVTAQPTSAVTYQSARVTTATPHALSVGDVVRFGANLVSTPCYVVKTIVNTTTVDLTSPYTGASNAAIVTNILTIVPATTPFGLKFDAFDTSAFSPDLADFVLNDFTLATIGFGDTTVTTNSLSKMGSGSYKRVAQLEHRDVTQDGTYNYSTIPMDTFRKFAVSGTNYDGIFLQFKGKQADTHHLAPTPRNQQALIYMPTGGAALTALKATINAWITTLPVPLPAI